MLTQVATTLTRDEVDDAHGLGVVGQGRGTAAHFAATYEGEHLG